MMPPVTGTSIRDYWDAQAEVFDAEPDHGLADPATAAAWRSLLLRLAPPPPARVADLGCGTGTLSVLLAAEGYHVTGLDLAPKMVARARAKAAGGGVAAEFVVGDAASPALAPGFLDVVLARHVVWALPDPAAALARWTRLLRPGGRLLLVEGRWSTGGGLPSADLTALVEPLARDVVVHPLSDAVFWGRGIDDERYALVAHT